MGNFMLNFEKAELLKRL